MSKCVCGREQSSLNELNWNRHLEACQVRKSKRESKDIKSYFTLPQLKKQRTDVSAVNEKCLDEIEEHKTTKLNNNSHNDEDQPFISTSSKLKISDGNDEYSASASKDIGVQLYRATKCIDDLNENPDENNQEQIHLLTCKNDEPSKTEATEVHTDNYEKLDSVSTKKHLQDLSILDSVFPNDPANWPDNISYQLLSYYVQLGPCQPSPLDLKLNAFPKKKDSTGNIRSFHESYYFKRLSDGQYSKRTWLSYSPSLDKIFCMTCKLFGLVNAKKSFLASKGSSDFRNIAKTISHHESLPEHLQSEISRGLYTANTRLDLTLLESSNRQIAENRKVVEVIIDALLYAARQNIALRGHDESCNSINKGNFLELLDILGKYHAPLNAHLQRINSINHNRLTFLSSDSQNHLLNILAEMVRSKILICVKKAKLFSVIIDTTTDVSSIEQFTFLLRYVNEEGKIEERLIALVSAPDSTGRGMFEIFCQITEKYNIDWKHDLCAQAYDGAASMQGQYSGLKTLIQKENPNALYVWCSAHLLNLVVVDTCDCCMDTKVFFGDVKALVEFMRARKRTACFVESQKQLYPNQRVKRLKRFSSTRWTSHDRVITVVFDKYAALLKSLKSIAALNSSDRDTSSTANSLTTRITSFKFVSTMVLVKKIFSITTPVSNYLQSKSIDFIEAIKLVDVAKKRLTDLRTDDECNKILCEANEFAKDHSLLENNLKEIRTRKKKVMPGELSKDETSTSALDIFRRDVYFKVLDVIINSISSRFRESREVMNDLGLLSPERLLLYRKSSGNSLPDDAFKNLSKWIYGIDLHALKIEYLTFSSSLHELIDGLAPKQLHNTKNTSTTDIISENETDSETSGTENEEINVNKKVSVEKILHVLSSYDLKSAFPNLYQAYKSLGTIPASSASAERSFSKVKLIKTRLRSTTGQSRLESLVLLSTEKDIPIDYNDAINKFAMSSELLTKHLIFK